MSVGRCGLRMRFSGVRGPLCGLETHYCPSTADVCGGSTGSPEEVWAQPVMVLRDAPASHLVANEDKLQDVNHMLHLGTFAGHAPRRLLHKTAHLGLNPDPAQSSYDGTIAA